MHVSLCSAHGQFYFYLYLYLYNDSELLCSSPDRTLTVLIQVSGKVFGKVLPHTNLFYVHPEYKDN